ncbi:DgyrCDS443 [Dimorphilus gyrociliatus]|uniref:DgyrCDS443 n=1 Tax=Dimorphilus gyrociliatus TaxID=2664684 RepID=A0A7I8V4P6_9ANNE|nr:DgyrCDS443 [Dimorphilus gyrociliatus]
MDNVDNSQDDEHEFVDAKEEVDNSCPMHFDESLEAMKSAFNLFLNNHFEEAKNRLQKWAKEDMYHALGYAVILHLQASMTREAVNEYNLKSIPSYLNGLFIHRVILN